MSSTASKGLHFTEALQKSRAERHSTKNYLNVQTASDVNIRRTMIPGSILVPSSPATGQAFRSAYFASMVSPPQRERNGMPFATSPAGPHCTVKPALLQPIFATPRYSLAVVSQPVVQHTPPLPQGTLLAHPGSSPLMRRSLQLQLMEELRREQMDKDYQLMLDQERAAQFGGRSQSILSPPPQTPTVSAALYEALLRNGPGNAKDGAN